MTIGIGTVRSQICFFLEVLQHVNAYVCKSDRQAEQTKTMPSTIQREAVQKFKIHVN